MHGGEHLSQRSHIRGEEQFHRGTITGTALVQTASSISFPSSQPKPALRHSCVESTFIGLPAMIKNEFKGVKL